MEKPETLPYLWRIPMTEEEIYKTWEPETSVWSRWVTPALFAQLNRISTLDPLSQVPEPDLGWLPTPSDRYALIVDLPGAELILFAVSLAQKGYRPVPVI